MKKKIVFLLLVLLITTVALAACNQVEPTKVQVRWMEEKHTFHVSLADFYHDANGNPTDGFATYLDGDNTYVKDKQLMGENFSTLDEIRPYAVDGTYTMEIAKEGTDSWKVTTEQTLYVQYNEKSQSQDKTVTVELNESNGAWNQLKELAVTSEEIAANAPTLQEESGKVILKSTTKTSVIFKDQTQLPTSSYSEVNGFYIGAANQQASKYSVSTVYDFSKENKPVATVKLNDSEETVYNLPTRGATTIDANQLLLYLRSLEKTGTSFQDTPSVYLFYPLTGKTVRAAFTFNYGEPMRLTDISRSTDNEKNVVLNLVGVMINNMAYMLQENIPDIAGIDSNYINGDNLHQYTTVRFRVGYLAYELSSYTDQVWNALKTSYETQE